MANNVYVFAANDIAGHSVSLSEFRGRVLLIVNVASRCGYTPQYAGLEKLWREYRECGLVVLGFPCNQFGNQEPDGEAEIETFCRGTYDVTFPLFAKVEVNGDEAHDLYRYLQSALPGLFGTRSIKWNFTKFLVDREGKPCRRFSPSTPPQDLAAEIERLL